MCVCKPASAFPWAVSPWCYVIRLRLLSCGTRWRSAGPSVLVQLKLQWRRAFQTAAVEFVSSGVWLVSTDPSARLSEPLPVFRAVLGFSKNTAHNLFVQMNYGGPRLWDFCCSLRTFLSHNLTPAKWQSLLFKSGVHLTTQHLFLFP